MLLVQVIVGGLLLGAIYALFSAGLTLIWGMMNFINFAHGEFVMLGMYVALLVVVWLNGGPASFGLAAASAVASACQYHAAMASNDQSASAQTAEAQPATDQAGY